MEEIKGETGVFFICTEEGDKKDVTSFRISRIYLADGFGLKVNLEKAIIYGLYVF